MATTTTTQAKCPATVCICGGTETVAVRVGTDRRTGRATRTYAPCAPLKAQGWIGRIASVEWA